MDPQGSNDLRKVLHESVAPYFASTYNTLVAVAQSVALGELAYKILEEDLSILVFLKGVTVFGVLVTVWHKYVRINQYIGWRLDIWDSIIPMLFGIIQFVTIFSLRRPVGWFSAFIASATLLGFLAYLHAVNKFSCQTSIALFQEHFNNSKLADDLFWEINEFWKDQQIAMLVATVLLGGLTFLNFYLDCCEDVKTYLTTAFCIGMLSWMTYFDVARRLNNSAKDSLSAYKGKW